MIMRRSKLARYFSRRHSKTVEAEKRVVVYLWREEQQQQYRATLAGQQHRSTITAGDFPNQASSMVEQMPSGPPEPRTIATTSQGPRLDIQPVLRFMKEQLEQSAQATSPQDERVSIGSNSSAINTERRRNHTPKDISASQDIVPPLHPTPKRSPGEHEHSPSLYSKSADNSTTPSHTSADFETPDFAELMDGLAIVMSKLNPRNDSVVGIDSAIGGFGIAEEVAAVVPDASRYSGYIVMVPRISEEEEDEEHERERIGRSNENKNDVSRSTI
ncbi:hypothetical protein M436DRAFT_61767 [Aureobasidium namibiae CBS 147.97]|uniref:Uncharacterized protein n=1 Tax=Aureobasidium namibiae CBS 147.97 TaxID=1043004 RepID=A0A074WUX6_9PEZI|nr:uncharacterized protein M436DRAFT_61767 [Aureobasidium namibiae CBS 147.97]KEQ75354.1 hypothetical protein M436DRAFT_61767 [Aureobasidium namibiae CBS 147.97]